MQLNEEDFKRLDGLNQEAHARVTESVFVKRLLPHLVPPEDGSRVDVSIYNVVAGHPSRPIDVVSDTDPQTILYTVPPLISQTPMHIRDKTTRPGTDIGELSAIYDAEITITPPALVIDRFVDKLMALSFTSVDAIEMTYALMWATIYRRYNLPLERLFGDKSDSIRKLVGLTPEADTQAKAAVMEEFDDDDFEAF